METVIRGRAFVFGKNIDTDQIYPGRFVEYTEIEDIKKYAMYGADEKFTEKCQPGDIIVASTNFGCGSSREHAAMTLKYVGVGEGIDDLQKFDVDDYVKALFYRDNYEELEKAKIAEENKYSDEEFIKICKEASTMSQACTILGYSSFNTFMRKAKKLGCYNPNQGSKGIKRKSKGIPVEDILAGKYPDYNTYKLKIKLIKAGIKEDKCEKCG